MTGIELEKISDIDKYLFIEKGLRGGIFYIAKKHSRADNKYLNDYDPKKQSTFISHSRTPFRVNPHSILAWMSRNSLLEEGAKSEV